MDIRAGQIRDSMMDWNYPYDQTEGEGVEAPYGPILEFPVLSRMLILKKEKEQ